MHDDLVAEYLVHLKRLHQLEKELGNICKPGCYFGPEEGECSNSRMAEKVVIHSIDHSMHWESEFTTLLLVSVMSNLGHAGQHMFEKLSFLEAYWQVFAVYFAIAVLIFLYNSHEVRFVPLQSNFVAFLRFVYAFSVMLFAFAIQSKGALNSATRLVHAIQIGLSSLMMIYTVTFLSSTRSRGCRYLKWKIGLSFFALSSISLSYVPGISVNIHALIIISALSPLAAYDAISFGGAQVDSETMLKSIGIFFMIILGEYVQSLGFNTWENIENLIRFTLMFTSIYAFFKMFFAKFSIQENEDIETEYSSAYAALYCFMLLMLGFTLIVIFCLSRFSNLDNIHDYNTSIMMHIVIFKVIFVVLVWISRLRLDSYQWTKKSSIARASSLVVIVGLKFVFFWLNGLWVDVWRTFLDVMVYMIDAVCLKFEGKQSLYPIHMGRHIDEFLQETSNEISINHSETRNVIS